MNSGGIFNGPTAVGSACAGCGQVEPQPWWAEAPKTTPWWHETPTLLKPVQVKPWYLPAEKGPTTPEVIEAKYGSPNTGLVIVGVLAGLTLLAGALGGRTY
jgi:hypothetical protein